MPNEAPDLKLLAGVFCSLVCFQTNGDIVDVSGSYPNGAVKNQKAKKTRGVSKPDFSIQ